MTLLLTIFAGAIMTAIAVAVGGLMLEMVLSILSRSLQPSTQRVIRVHRISKNRRAVDWRERVAA
ncbi:MAG TPA: hypothetical protein VNO14_10460 [Blastocatellia bacterium]|nr:hypothetical protein [Blastocatellia bacterium]